MKTINLLSTFLFVSIFVSALSSCAEKVHSSDNDNITMQDSSINLDKLDTATFGAGCFWCVEAVFQDMKGVVSVQSGYAGGSTKNPSYKEVCSGTTGHAEVARIVFDSSIISYETLLTILWHAHDPTTVDRQGNDVGSQYRSVVYYHSEDQRLAAEKSKKDTDDSGLWSSPIVTKIEPIPTYYAAEDYHQNYFKNNPNQGYCSMVVGPKVAKVRKEFKHLLKD
ncbi:MAG: peptide-methionine (S)-S-oxide reductase [Bacteroidia bacterium]|jgi:peptide-methionine (S)-S-oxide reductase